MNTAHVLMTLAAMAAVTLTALLQWRLKHPLLSILCGTALYAVWRNGSF